MEASRRAYDCLRTMSLTGSVVCVLLFIATGTAVRTGESQNQAIMSHFAQLAMLLAG